MSLVPSEYRYFRWKTLIFHLINVTSPKCEFTFNLLNIIIHGIELNQFLRIRL